MPFVRRYILAFLSLLLAFPIFAQQTPTAIQRDPQAIAILQASVRAMGGTAPLDSVATGNITIVAGSQTSAGTIRILTRGTNQTSEQMTLPQSTTALTYSGGLADETINNATTSLSLERAATSQSVYFPLPFLSGALANSDVSVQYVALETLNQSSLLHIRLQNTFASQPNLHQFASFAVFDVWLDSVTSLPRRISYTRRDASGAAPGVAVDTYFTSYQTISGVAYPSRVNVSFNGTPWTTIAISTVTFNTGLTDSNFSVQ